MKWEEVFGGYLPFDVHRVPPTDPSSSKREMNCTNRRTRDGVNGKLRPFVNPTIKKCRVIIDITYFSDTLYTQRDAMDYNRYFKQSIKSKNKIHLALRRTPHESPHYNTTETNLRNYNIILKKSI